MMRYNRPIYWAGLTQYCNEDNVSQWSGLSNDLNRLLVWLENRPKIYTEYARSTTVYDLSEIDPMLQITEVYDET